MPFSFSHQSEAQLATISPKLRAVARRALQLSPIDFRVIEGHRTEARQRQLVAAHHSFKLNSKHLSGHAFDFAPIIDGQVRWDWPLFKTVATAMKAAAKELGIKINWGGDWKHLRDGPHIELANAE